VGQIRKKKKKKARTFSRLVIGTVAVLLGFTTFPSQAASDHHPIEIGQAKSLP
jgi:hypothetical protein